MNIGDPASGDHLPGIGAGQHRGEEARVVRPYLRPSAVGRLRKTPPPALSAALGVSGLVRGVRRRLGVALSLGLLLATAGALAAWFGMSSATYSARSMLQISSTPLKVVFDTIDQAADSHTSFINYQKTQEQLIKSRFVLDKALMNPSVAKLPSVISQPDPVEWLADELSITFVGEVLFIGFESDKKEEVVSLVNAVTDAYMNEVVDADHARRLARLASLQKIYDEYQKNMNARQKMLNGLAEQAGSNDKATVAYRQQLANERLNIAERDLRERRSELLKAKIELEILQKTPQAQVKETAGDVANGIKVAVEEALEQDPMIQSYRAQVAELDGKIKAHLRNIRSGSDPAIRIARSELAAVRNRLKNYREELAKRLTTRFENQHEREVAESRNGQQGGDERDMLMRRIEVLERFEKDLAAEVASLERGVHSLNKTALSLESTRDDIQHAERAADVIGQEVESLKVEVDAPPRIRLVEKAAVPRALSGKKRIMATGFAGCSMFALALLGVAWLDARVRRIDKVDDVVHGLGMDLVGTLPPLAVRSRRALNAPPTERDRNETGLLMEAVDSTRAMLMHVLRNESIRTVMVASAQKGEGKTSLACHLATSLARARQRTLLIDCDLRCPTTHMLFDLPQGPGVCEVLRGECDVTDAIQPTAAPRLSLLTSGRCDALAIEALGHGSLQRLFDQVRGQFDYVIVDSAPVLAVADSLQICQHVDAVLFTVLRDVSRLPRIHAAYEQLSRLGVRMLGVVVAGTQVEDHGYRYAYQGRGADAKPDVAQATSEKAES